MGIGEMVRQRRRELGHSQVAAAQVIGVAGPTISRWESGDQVPQPDQIEALAQYLDLPRQRVLVAIHEQSTRSESDDRIEALLMELRAEVAELRQIVERDASAS